MKDPNYAAFGRESQFGRSFGWAGDFNQKATLACSKYVVVDTFARAVPDGNAEGAIKRGAEQLKQIYAC